MSVTCHNFVRNAWKKDLCSNCFKSVGDHQGTVEQEQEDYSVCPEHRNGTSPSQTGNSNGGTNVPNPHTTWKSLISERNDKNTQPFKLETGFKGRLLTINKALNGTDKQSNGEAIKAKIAARIATKEGYVKATTNGYMKIEEESKTGEVKLNGNANQKNGKTKANDVHDREKVASPSNGYKSNLKKPNIDGKFDARQTKLAKTNSEEATDRPCLQSILKKGSSPEKVQNGSQPRRSSNVGFASEEPLVIGYGGRDFSPEELEWEMASDGDAESTSDSLDETEDDKVFTTITKQNTEFNSDTTNLLENEGSEGSVDGATESSDDGEVQSPKTNNDFGHARGPKSARTQHAEVGRGGEKQNPARPSGDDPRSRETPKKPRTSAGSRDRNCHVETTGGNSATNVETQGDKTSHATKTSGARDSEGKNSSPLINGAPPSSVDGREAAESERESNAAMFSADQEQAWQGSESPANEVPGQILQAINTSLTNRHKMKDEQNAEETSPPGGNTVSVSVNNGIAEASNESSSRILSDAEDSSLSVEPRDSFLHGAGSKPSAIYGPASDLFVSRSNSSSSSSSSDDQGKISLSINVIVNNDRAAPESNEYAEADEADYETADVKTPENPPEAVVQPKRELKQKPKIPAKPSTKPNSNGGTKTAEEPEDTSRDRTEENVVEDTTYYSTIPYSEKHPSDLVDAYAESNIYHEVGENDVPKPHESVAKTPGRESKLAALAVELEQARNTSTKRQAPAPPKIPDPPLEDPPSCSGRVSPTDPPQTFATFRGEHLGFSSASSTTSTSSQDTEAGYASWNLQGDSDDAPKNKFKSSFLLAQYSKCKMLAMGVAEDGAKARKRFSIKKLLKIGKESESPGTSDINSPTQKAWKYNEHFERPRAKLEIIHPMDLENKTVTVNPGFDSRHSGSMSSFGANPDQVSYRNSMSNSDYGSYYSDTLSPHQDMKNEVNYEYIQPRIPMRDDHEDSSSKAGTSSSTSPTPSRSSTASQASTITSGSSKTGATHRPPKPPPPPRAHSLLPGNKIMQNVDGSFKFPTNGDTSSSDEVTAPPKKPQAPRRQCKSTVIRSEYSNSDFRKSTSDLTTYDQPLDVSISEDKKTTEIEESFVKNVSTIQITHSNSQASQNIEDAEPAVQSRSSNDGIYDNVTVQNEPKIQASITIQSKVSSHKEKPTKTGLIRNKQSPLTKSPARPPPIYSKPQSGGSPKNLHPWKTLEDSYFALTSSNRELLIKLVNQASRRKKNFISKLNKFQFHWSDFEIDTSQPSSIFAFGEKIAYHATMPRYPEYVITLVISVQHPQSPETSEIKYPLYGKFIDSIPSDLLDSSEDSSELVAIPATVLVLDRSTIATIESYSESLPDHLAEENEKELAFIILQMIQSLKTLQVQGIEAIDCNFQSIVLAKTKQDKYHSLIFLHDSCYEENDLSSDACKVSLCQYTLMLLFQMLKLQAEDDPVRFSSNMSKKVFETAFSLLSEEKAVSLSQTKILFECYLWGVTRVMESLQTLDDCDSVFQRWLDIERSNFIKSVVNEEDAYDLNVQSDYYSQFLIRTSARNIKEIASYL